MNFKNPGAAVAAPGVKGEQLEHHASAFACAQAAALKASQYRAVPSFIAPINDKSNYSEVILGGNI
ncbi:hypothetical protein predicted by Glimmer/Critica [Bordetella petrii]|uniref:Uncharacterized protein n=1 Tax=Bordetella petrii (strain ATCC BAA-461 / DSM 12804 / CCUG 43448 / CIP 107267 / Se-1111R) TaxID=340100 RepID=A9IL01_BORPD|nr:hypothetical protein predicted by Glimmer/Critica [Bordetella petrii]